MSIATPERSGGGAEHAWRWFFRALLAATLLMVNALLVVGIMQIPRAFDAVDRVSESAAVSLEESADAVSELSNDLSNEAAEARRAAVAAGDDMARAVELLEEALIELERAANAITESLEE